MGGYIRNVGQLLDHGNRVLRRHALDVIEAGLRAADPGPAVARIVRREGKRLLVADEIYDLERFDRVWIIGAGKASRPIVETLERVLGDCLTGGIVILKRGDRGQLERVRAVYASHPIPDEASLAGARAILDLAAGFSSRDLVFAAITGGSSSLLVLPAEGITLADMQQVNRVLLGCGADIFQMNAVRKHLSAIKGGRLAQRIFPATLVNLTVSDVVGDALDYITDPTVPDTSTFEDACRVMDDYGLIKELPHAVVQHLRGASGEMETPKAFPGQPLQTVVVVPSHAAVDGAYTRASSLGYRALLLTSMMEGEAREAGTVFSSILREAAFRGHPCPAPCAILAAGENTVTLDPVRNGAGGPNQEFSLAGALKIAGLSHTLMASIDTDGTDGPTEVAGAIVDGDTCPVALSRGLDPAHALRIHDSLQLLRSTGDLVETGATGTNVNDLKLGLIDGGPDG